jgi:hypothetical protein
VAVFVPAEVFGSNAGRGRRFRGGLASFFGVSGDGGSRHLYLPLN